MDQTNNSVQPTPPPVKVDASIPTSPGFLMFLGWLDIIASLLVGGALAAKSESELGLGIAIVAQGILGGTLLIVISHTAQWVWDIRRRLGSLGERAEPQSSWKCPKCGKLQPAWSTECSCGYHLE